MNLSLDKILICQLVSGVLAGIFIIINNPMNIMENNTASINSPSEPSESLTERTPLCKLTFCSLICWSRTSAVWATGAILSRRASILASHVSSSARLASNLWVSAYMASSCVFRASTTLFVSSQCSRSFDTEKEKGRCQMAKGRSTNNLYSYCWNTSSTVFYVRVLGFLKWCPVVSCG